MPSPFHPALVHVPIALAILMPLVTGGLLLAWWRGALPRRVWSIAIALQAVLLVSGVAALQTGEADEERVEAVAPEWAIEAHEEAAQTFVAGAAAALALGILAGVVASERAARRAAAATVAATVLVLALGYRTGEAGGRLVYEHGAASAYGAAGVTVVARGEDGHDD